MKKPSLTEYERRIAKRLVADGMSNQDAHHLINLGRNPSVNFGRLSGAKDWDIEPASNSEVEHFKYEKTQIDLKTGLSPFKDERLVKAREAMLLAIQDLKYASFAIQGRSFLRLIEYRMDVYASRILRS